jgi:hypothetical protein
MKKIVLLFLGILFSNFTFLQTLPKIDVKPSKEKGKVKIYYRLKSELKYIPNTKLIDWQNSLEKLESPEVYNTKKKYFVENCIYKDGKRNGEFFLSELKFQNNKLIAGSGFIQGIYLNDKFDGKVKFVNSTDGYRKIVEIEYKQGSIADQQVLLTSIYSKYTIEYLIKYTFKNGVVSEINADSEKKDIKFYHKINGDFCLNRKYYIVSDWLSYWLEYYTQDLPDYASYNFKEPLVKEGEIRVFMGNTQKTFDTTNLVAIINVTNGGIRNGLSQFYDNGKLKEECNFKNGFVDGKCVRYFKDGKIEIESLFSDGYIKEVSFYSDGSDFNTNYINYKGIPRANSQPFTSESIPFSYISDTYQGKRISRFFLDQLVLEENKYQTNFEIIKASGGKISAASGPQLLYKLNFISDEKYSYVQEYSWLNNGKPMVTYIVDKDKHDLKDVLWKDETGKIVYSLNKKLEADKKAKETINNSIVNCSFCSKKIKFGDAVITGGDCNCFEYKNGEKKKIHVGIFLKETYFCSRKCVSDFERDCCRKNGFSFE